MINKNEIYMNIAFEISKCSKCVSKQVGCIAVKNDRILASGYNGTPSGYKNCNEYFDYLNFNRQEHHLWSNKYEVHSELNLINFCAKYGIELDGSGLYVTLRPCFQCSKNIIQSGIKRIYYKDEYDLELSEKVEIDDFLKDNKIEIYKL